MRFIRNPCPPRPGRAFPTRPDRRAAGRLRASPTHQQACARRMAVPATVDAQFERMRGDRFAIGHRRARQGRGLGAQHRNTPLRSSSENATVPMPCQPRSRATLAATARSALSIDAGRCGAGHSAINTRASRQTLRSQARPVRGRRPAAPRHGCPACARVRPRVRRGPWAVRAGSGAARRYDCGNFCSHRPLPVFLLAWQAYHLRMTGIGDGARGAVRRRCRPKEEKD